jgi:hypothetical protein
MPGTGSPDTRNRPVSSQVICSGTGTTTFSSGSASLPAVSCRGWQDDVRPASQYNAGTEWNYWCRGSWSGSSRWELKSQLDTSLRSASSGPPVALTLPVGT